MDKGDLETLHRILESRAGFGHREHIELAWSYIRVHGSGHAADPMCDAIRHVAWLHGAEEKYHETMTRAWLHLVAVHAERWATDTFVEFLDRNPDLLDTNLIQHFYSPDALFSEAARTSWIYPDWRRLPTLA